jgi:hypothetical protein
MENNTLATRDAVLGKHITVVFSVCLVALLYCADKFELQRKIALYQVLVHLEAVHGTMEHADEQLEGGTVQQRALLALKAQDSLLFERHRALRLQVIALAERFGGHEAVINKFARDRSPLRLIFLSTRGDEQHDADESGSIATDLREESIGQWYAEVTDVLNDPCKVFVPTRMDTSRAARILAAPLENAVPVALEDSLITEYDTRSATEPPSLPAGSREVRPIPLDPQPSGIIVQPLKVPNASSLDARYVLSKFAVRTLDADTQKLCVNGSINQTQQTDADMVTCEKELPIDSGVWVHLGWGALLGIPDSVQARMRSAELEQARIVYRDLSVEEATGLLTNDIVAAYGSFELFGVAIRVHYLALIMAVVLIGSVLLGLLLLRSGNRSGEEGSPAIPLLLRSRWGKPALLFVLPVVAVMVSLPHYEISWWHWTTVIGLLVVYILITARLTSAASAPAKP